MFQDIADYFHKDFQRSLIANLIRCPSLVQQIQSGKITQEDVDLPIHKAILLASSEIIKVQGGVDPEVGVPIQLLGLQLKSMLNAGVIYKEEKDPLIHEVDIIYNMGLNPDYFKGVLSFYLSEVRLKKLIKTYKPGQAEDFVNKASKAFDSSKDESRMGATISPLLQCQLTDEVVQVVPCGINSIDSRMGGGLGKSEFGVICGISGLGKTTLAVNFCWGAAATKRSALITLEIPGSKISERLYSRITQIDYNRIRYGENGTRRHIKEEMWERIEAIPIEMRSNFDIWDFAEKPCTLQDIDEKLRLSVEMDKKPDMVFLDWLDALETAPSDRNNGFVAKELRHQLQNYSKGCSDLAKKYNVAFWATTQSNSAGDNKRQVRMSNAAEGFSKAWRCSVFLGIGATDQDRENGRLTVKASKMRDGATFETQIQARLDKQTFEDVPPDLQFAAPQEANFTPLLERT